jgi:hypothetical protein
VKEPLTYLAVSVCATPTIPIARMWPPPWGCAGRIRVNGLDSARPMWTLLGMSNAERAQHALRAIADRRVTRPLCVLAPLSEPPNGCVTGVPVCGMLVVRTGPLVSTCAPWNV